MRPLLRNSKKSHQFFSNQGFTLIEILVALVLIVLIMALAISNPFSSRGDLDKEVNSIERALRFMGDEAVLRNAVLRIHFILDREPQEYAVEYGPSDNFILPSAPKSEGGLETKDEENKKKKTLKDLNLKFNRVSEFSEKNSEISSNIKILGVANSQSEKVQNTGEVSLYAFPSGERDAALVIIASEEEVVTLKTNSFSPKIEREIIKIPKNNEKELIEYQNNLVKEIFLKWKKVN
jgi:prepilin-type N-terminal cleavage/methylation domain-containing protein